MNTPQSISYPDNGNPLEDPAVLRNAVNFSTQERAYSAQLILQHLTDASQASLNFLIVRAFEEFMTSTEDLTGWLFVLQEWQPGDARNSIFSLLDRVAVGKGRHKEANAVSLLSAIDADAFQKLIHVPTYEELVSTGKIELANRLKQSIPAKLDGWRTIVAKRANQDRGLVGMFNKLKHHMLAFPTMERGKAEIWMPFNVVNDYADGKLTALRMGRGWLGANLDSIRMFVYDAITAQAVLHDTLALILITRYNYTHTVPQWITQVYQGSYIWQV